jgi:hypothetical protein
MKGKCGGFLNQRLGLEMARSLPSNSGDGYYIMGGQWAVVRPTFVSSFKVAIIWHGIA